MCTGTPPPGGDKGKSFVHDPKLAGVAEVKGCIKLRFKNRAGQDMVVIRSLQLTQKKVASVGRAEAEGGGEKAAGRKAP